MLYQCIHHICYLYSFESRHQAFLLLIQEVVTIDIELVFTYPCPLPTIIYQRKKFIIKSSNIQVQLLHIFVKNYENYCDTREGEIICATAKKLKKMKSADNEFQCHIHQGLFIVLKGFNLVYLQIISQYPQVELRFIKNDKLNIHKDIIILQLLDIF